MTAPTLTTAQKDALYDLMTSYFNAAPSTFTYVGAARRESYAHPNKTSADTPTEGCMSSSNNKYFLNCGLLAQMVWMGRKISDFTGNATTPSKTINKEFSWGYYFDFASARIAYGVTKNDGSKYNANTYVNSAGDKVFITFDNAAAMAEELYNKGYEIPYSEADIGDLVFYRSESIVDDDIDQLENANFRYITHAALVCDITADGVPILLECTNAGYSNGVMGRCGVTADEGIKETKMGKFGSLRGANLGFRNVMCARHPVAFGHTGNVPSSFSAYRGVDELD